MIKRQFIVEFEDEHDLAFIDTDLENLKKGFQECAENRFAIKITNVKVIMDPTKEML